MYQLADRQSSLPFVFLLFVLNVFSWTLAFDAARRQHELPWKVVR